MLEALVSIIKPGFEVAAAVIGTAAILYRASGESHGKEDINSNRIPFRPVWIGLALAVLAGAVGSYFLHVGAIERDYFDGITALIASLGVLMLIILVWSKPLNPHKIGLVVAIAVTFIALPGAFDVILQPSKVLHMSGMLDTELLSKVSGMVFGVLIAVVAGALLVRAGKKMPKTGLIVSTSAMLITLLVRQLIIAVQFGFTYGFIPLVPGVVSVVAPLINGYETTFYWLLAALLLYVPVYFVTSRRREAVETANPAELRKHKATIRAERRLFTLAALTIVVAISIVTGASIAEEYKKRASELSPAVDIKAVGDMVKFPLDEVTDGKLHRFAFTASDGTKVRFLVIHKGSGVYGVAFDFCDICGPAGYYQRGNDVVCKNCDVAINIPTIGFPGGCNPVPLDHRVTGGRILIDVADIEAVKDTFH